MGPRFAGAGRRSLRRAHADPGRDSARFAAADIGFVAAANTGWPAELERGLAGARPPPRGTFRIIRRRLGVPAGQGVVEGNEIPYQPWALAKKQENFKNRLTADLVEARGFLPGVPRIMYMPLPFQIVQTPKYVTMVYEYGHAVRIIYTDGTKHPRGPIEFWLGDSRGRWEGDTLVSDVIHFNDRDLVRQGGQFP